MNTPTNPTGTVYSEKTVCGIVNIARRHNLLMVSDEVYSTLIFVDKMHFSALNVTPAYEKILFVDSCSKKFSMTGWRVGLAVGLEEWIGGIVKLQENVAAFEKRRDILVKELKKSDKLSFAIELLKDKHVAVVPGVAYGDDFDNYVRIAFTLQDSLIEEAAKRIVAFAKKVKCEGEA